MVYRKHINHLSIYHNLDQLLTLPTHLIMVFQSFYQTFWIPSHKINMWLKIRLQLQKKIRVIPQELSDHGYRFVSFDVESLFTSVLLSKTINIILGQTYHKKLLKTNIKKRTLKKLLIVALFDSTILFTNK